jgi:hypothetical protein
MHRILAITAILGAAFAHVASAGKPAQFKVEESWDIAKVPSAFPVGFCLLTEGKRQYVAYYDEERRMTIASKALDANKWQYQVLPTEVGWDSHNYITMAVDRDGQLHVSGNMHCVPLIYFRTETPGDITTLKQLPMTGQQETSVTYPQFLADHEGRLIFNYREGGSGRGMRIYNKYELKTRTWSRLLDKPLLDGEGERNAYPLGPVPGPDGWFHLVWVWRDTPDCASNHHLSYARSQDLLHWESVQGQRMELPLKLDQESLWVDPIPSGGGIINGCEKLTFDTDNRPIVSYHKSDDAGNMQVYAARPAGRGWIRHVLTDWSKPIHFGGHGSMGFIGISIGELSQVAPGILTMSYRHRDYGSGRLVIDEKTLRPLEKTVEIAREYPAELDQIHGDFDGMEVQRSVDIGDSGSGAVRYMLQWETLGKNRDRPRQPPLPGPSTLRLYQLTTVEGTATTHKAGQETPPGRTPDL